MAKKRIAIKICYRYNYHQTVVLSLLIFILVMDLCLLVYLITSAHRVDELYSRENQITTAKEIHKVVVSDVISERRKLRKEYLLERH